MANYSLIKPDSSSSRLSRLFWQVEAVRKAIPGTYGIEWDERFELSHLNRDQKMLRQKLFLGEYLVSGGGCARVVVGQPESPVVFHPSTNKNKTPGVYQLRAVVGSSQYEFTLEAMDNGNVKKLRELDTQKDGEVASELYFCLCPNADQWQMEENFFGPMGTFVME